MYIFPLSGNGNKGRFPEAQVFRERRADLVYLSPDADEVQPVWSWTSPPRGKRAPRVGISSTCSPSYRCRANVAHIRQSMPDSGLGVQVKVLKVFPLRERRADLVYLSPDADEVLPAALKERCPPRQTSRVERLKEKVEPLLT